MATASVYDHSFTTSLRTAVQESENQLVPALGPCPPDLKEFYIHIPLWDGHLAEAKVWHPPEGEAMPVILLFHGGGFVAGSCDQLTRPGREFARTFGAVVLSASYRLAPEHKFPQAMLDGLDIASWISQHASGTLPTNLSAGFIVGGYSAGGQLAAVVASEARTKGLPHPITGSFLCIPQFFTASTIPESHRHLWTSREPNGKADSPLTPEVMDKLNRSMQADPTSPWFNPLHSPRGLRGLPSTYFQCGGKDILRDDAVVYEMLLREAGVATKLDVHAELGHEAWTIWTDEKAETTERLRNKTLEGMSWLLEK